MLNQPRVIGNRADVLSGIISNSIGNLRENNDSWFISGVCEVNMEKIILKKLGFTFVVLSMFIFILFAGIIFFTESKTTFQELDETIQQIEVSYKKSQIKNIPTLYEQTVFVIDGNTGKIMDISQNNEQEINIDDVESTEEYVSILRNSNNGKLIKINGTKKFLKTKNTDNLTLGAYVEAAPVFRTMRIQITYFLAGMLAVLISVIMIVRYYLRRYVLQDISSIESSIKELMAGNTDITFETKYNTEFRHITAVLNDLKDSYKTKKERMSRMISSIDGHMAVFECLYSINQNFFSDNTPSILGMDDKEWEEITKTPKGFEKYLTSLISESEEDILKLENDRYIRIISFHKENEFYGMIMDKTEDMKMKMKIEQELHAAQEGAEMDPLTLLSNRAGLEKKVKTSLENEPGQGTMLIFDLDNFKLVNDQLGHPEGDIVLKKFAGCLKAYFRKNDIVARMGGDEFVVFIHSNIAADILSDKLEALLVTIRQELSSYYDRYGFSTSIGVAYVDQSINSYDDLYKCADAGLYIAKRLGKNRFYINEDHSQ
ncbi:GGDEF domain-containing protein [Paenibacillus sp. J45TS6]|uniref:sensor domain-containing diguanylate cyclase n=1 Tax=Paenibacillus sp. J45TS6 TaxID=2807196 RepID=UPI001BCB8E3E|nr:GGDEF domain-containing protein [Paenibacillus sp. J45TS6]